MHEAFIESREAAKRDCAALTGCSDMSVKKRNCVRRNDTDIKCKAVFRYRFADADVASKCTRNYLVHLTERFNLRVKATGRGTCT